jgi:cysteinyl-tRNA synthetase
MAKRIGEAAEEFDAGLSDDLNTARALGAMFEFVREANIAMDKGEFGAADVPAAQKFLQTFDQIFAVLENNHAQKLQVPGSGKQDSNAGDAEIEKLVAERQVARQTRDFATADRIRKELEKRGIILEDSRDGSVRWKRK